MARLVNFAANDAESRMPTRTNRSVNAAQARPPRTARDGLSIKRRRCGAGFSYHAKNGRQIRDPRIVSRLASLAVPPAYVDVAYAQNESAPLQAMGRDAAGRWQYRYHPDREKVRERRKSRHLLRLIEALPRIRRNLNGILAGRQPTREFAMAAAIALIDATGIRSGTSRHARLSGARGAVTLLKSSVKLNGRSITLTFRAKGGKHVVKDLNAPRLVPVIKVLQRLPGPRLFAYRENEQVKTIRVRDVNAFLCGMASCKISLKDFRTLRASIGVVKTLARTERSESQRRRKRQIKQAIQLAADDLANTATICRKSYVHGAVLEAFEEGTLTGGAKASSRKPPPARQILADLVSAQESR
jgi:DNA topoisomerase-1